VFVLFRIVVAGSCMPFECPAFSVWQDCEVQLVCSGGQTWFCRTKIVDNREIGRGRCVSGSWWDMGVHNRESLQRLDQKLVG